MSSKKCRPESHFTLNSPLKKKNFNYKISIFNYDKPSQTTTPSTTNTAATTTTKNHKRNSKSSKNKDAVRQRFYEQVLRPSRTAETHANFFKTEPRKEQDTKSQQPQLPETIPASHPERSICTTSAHTHQFFGINWKVRGNSLQRQQFQFDQIKWKLNGTYRRTGAARWWESELWTIPAEVIGCHQSLYPNLSDLNFNLNIHPLHDPNSLYEPVRPNPLDTFNPLTSHSPLILHTPTIHGHHNDNQIPLMSHLLSPSTLKKRTWTWHRQISNRQYKQTNFKKYFD